MRKYERFATLKSDVTSLLPVDRLAEWTCLKVVIESDPKASCSGFRNLIAGC